MKNLLADYVITKKKVWMCPNQEKKTFKDYTMVILKFCFIKFIFSDILYYTGQYGKEGLFNLYKKSFQLKVNPDETEYIQMTFNDKKPRTKEMLLLLQLMHSTKARTLLES